MDEKQKAGNISPVDDEGAASKRRAAVLEYVDALDNPNSSDGDDEKLKANEKQNNNNMKSGEKSSKMNVGGDKNSTKKNEGEKKQPTDKKSRPSQDAGQLKKKDDKTINKRQMRGSVAVSRTASTDKGTTPEITGPDGNIQWQNRNDHDELEAKRNSKGAAASSSFFKKMKDEKSSRTAGTSDTNRVRNGRASLVSTGGDTTSAAQGVPIDPQRQTNVRDGIDGPGAYSIEPSSKNRRMDANSEGGTRPGSMGDMSTLTRDPSHRNSTFHEELPIAAVLAPIDDHNEGHGDDDDDDRNNRGTGGGRNDSKAAFLVSADTVPVAQANPDNFSSMVQSSAFQRFLAVVALFIVCVAGIVVALIFVLQSNSSSDSTNNDNMLPTSTPTTPPPATVTRPTSSPATIDASTPTESVDGCISDTAALEDVIQNRISFALLCPGILVIEPTRFGATGIDFQQTTLYLACDDGGDIFVECIIDMKEYKFTNIDGNTDLSFEGIIFTTTSTERNLVDHTVFDLTGGTAWFLYCTFIDLAVGSNAGAAVRLSSDAGVDFEECYFSFNSVNLEGGAVWMSGFSEALFFNCTFEENESNEVGFFVLVVCRVCPSFRH